MEATPTMDDTSIITLADDMDELKQKKAKLAAETKGINKDIEKMQDEMLGFLKARGVKSIKLVDGRNVISVVSSFIKVDDKDKLYPWLKGKGYEDMFVVNPRTLSGFVNDRIKNNMEVPPGIEQYTKNKISIRR